MIVLLFPNRYSCQNKIHHAHFQDYTTKNFLIQVAQVVSQVILPLFYFRQLKILDNLVKAKRQKKSIQASSPECPDRLII
jgi:Na+/H+ antiporter NhaD/arsenite permease-like protein